jgi:transposase
MDVYGRGVEGKRAVAKELGIGLSTLYRLLAKG